MPRNWKDLSNVHVGEELKITVALSLRKLIMNDKQKELEFPSSLTAEERKYIHIVSQNYGLQSKSRGKGSMRFLTVYKKDGSTIMSKEAILQLGDISRSTILMRDLNLVRSLGRLTPGPPQVPPLPGHSEVTAEARKLPVWNMKDQLLNAINHNQVILVRGETGSGKTTQVPQIILEESSTLSKPCRIFCTQPRRISALSIAERVAAERGEKVGYTVGYQIRLEGKLSPKTLLTFCTTVLVDEVHERDRYTDFLLTVLRDCLSKFRHLKILLMSANLDANLYAKYFNNCPVIDVPGRTYSVKAFYLEDSALMRQYQQQLKIKQKGINEASEWARNVIKNLKAMPLGKDGEMNKESQNGHPEGAREKAQENGTKEPEIGGRDDVDNCIEIAFTSGDDEYFSQMLYYIMSENVSPDYQHTTTWASPLMVAAGRGRIDIVEQLLALGATVDLRAANEWTAADWAQSTGQQEIVDYLQSYSACEGIDLKTPEKVAPISMTTSEEDKELLEAYNLSLAQNKSSDTELLFALCLKIHSDKPPGAILVFLPGYEDIVALRDKILSEDKQFTHLGGKYTIFCLHSHMQSSDQKRVFRHAPPGVRKIVLSTNIAETSVTINDVVYVIDCGKIKEMSFDALSGVSCLRAVWVSQASAVQRRGRAGRCQPGIAYHLFSRSAFNLLQPHQTPEILRSPLQDLCLHTKLLAMPNMLIADFLARAPEPPAFMAVKNAVHLLKSMDALDPWEDVTELGHHLLDLPLPPNLGKMVITSTILKCLDPVLTIAACLAFRDPFVLPNHPGDKTLSKNSRKKFSSGTLSDHMVLLKAFQAWQKACTEHSQRSWCERNFISGATMEMIHGMRAQVLAQLRSSGFVRARGPGDISESSFFRDVNTNSDNWAVVKAALLSGIYPNLIRVDRDQKQLRTEKESKVRLHSSSVLLEFEDGDGTKIDKYKNLNQAHRILVSSLPTDWLLFDEMIRIGTAAHVKTVTLLSPITVLLMAGPMRLPLDALSEPSSRNHRFGDISSDSESEDRPEGMNSFLKIDQWVQFLGDHTTASLALQLRHKLHALILRRLRAPNKPLTQSDEDIVRVVAMVLSHEEQVLGLQQPPGVGQRPRPFYGTPTPDIDGMAMLNIADPHISSILSATSVPPPNMMGIDNNYVNNTNAMMGMPMHMVDSNYSTSVASASSGMMEPLNSHTNASSRNRYPHEKEKSSKVDATSPVANRHLKNNATGMQNNSMSNKSSSDGGKRRFFIIRVGAHKQIEVSQSRGLWAFAYGTERKVLQAAQNSTVILIFALNRGNQFHGFARFWGQKTDESCPEIANYGPPTGPLYKIEWIKKWYIHFHQARHLLNPYTDNLQVHMCRDGQEVEPSVGEQLIKVWDKGPSK
ncbi:putative ATP-dependent RNA helicase YTHDC2 [Armadillidium vulgare]|nr:putative ATP-dependent RNA helicase YTHDC2 [Armadillidium vulgare]